MQRDGAVLNMVLRIFLRVITQSLQDYRPPQLNHGHDAVNEEVSARGLQLNSDNFETGPGHNMSVEPTTWR